jgi:hypothetical protein
MELAKDRVQWRPLVLAVLNLQVLLQRVKSSCGRDSDRLCGQVVRVPGYRSRGPGFDSRRYQIFWEVVGLERGPLSLVRIIEELLERKVMAQV